MKIAPTNLTEQKNICTFWKNRNCLKRRDKIPFIIECFKNGFLLLFFRSGSPKKVAGGVFPPDFSF